MTRAGSSGGAFGQYEVPRLVADLVASTEALGALSAALWLRRSDNRASPQIEVALYEILTALGLNDVLSIEGSELATLSEMVRARIRQVCEFSLDPLQEPGWHPTEEGMVVAAALGGGTLAPLLANVIVPLLPGLSDRLAASGASFLEVGVGAGGLIGSLCRIWPTLHCTGIDIYEPALALAGRHIEALGLSARVQLRLQDAAELDDRDAYDLAWLPANFIAAPGLPAVVRRVFRASRPGGWLLLSTHGGEDDLSIALARLRTAREGGTLLSPSEAESLLAGAGWESVHVVGRHLIPGARIIAGRRGICPDGEAITSHVADADPSTRA
jgi:SAM-dependent methyltransferase